MITSNTPLDVTPSDNSHWFDTPFCIHEEMWTAIEIPGKELREWVARTIDLPIEFHFIFER